MWLASGGFHLQEGHITSASTSGRRIGIVLSGYAPAMTLMSGAMLGFMDKGIEFDAISTSGFGMTIDIINGGIECGQGQPTPQALDRIQLYQSYAAKLGVDPGGNLYC